MSARYGPRIGPKRCAGGGQIWIRRLEGRDYLFVSSDLHFAIYDTTDDQHHLVRYSTKDTA